MSGGGNDVLSPEAAKYLAKKEKQKQNKTRNHCPHLFSAIFMVAMYTFSLVTTIFLLKEFHRDGYYAATYSILAFYGLKSLTQIVVDYYSFGRCSLLLLDIFQLREYHDFVRYCQVWRAKHGVKWRHPYYRPHSLFTSFTVEVPVLTIQVYVYLRNSTMTTIQIISIVTTSLVAIWQYFQYIHYIRVSPSIYLYMFFKAIISTVMRVVMAAYLIIFLQEWIYVWLGISYILGHILVWRVRVNARKAQKDDPLLVTASKNVYQHIVAVHSVFFSFPWAPQHSVLDWWLGYILTEVKLGVEHGIALGTLILVYDRARDIVFYSLVFLAFVVLFIHFILLFFVNMSVSRSLRRKSQFTNSKIIGMFIYFFTHHQEKLLGQAQPDGGILLPFELSPLQIAAQQHGRDTKLIIDSDGIVKQVNIAEAELEKGQQEKKPLETFAEEDDDDDGGFGGHTATTATIIPPYSSFSDKSNIQSADDNDIPPPPYDSPSNTTSEVEMRSIQATSPTVPSSVFLPSHYASTSSAQPHFSLPSPPTSTSSSSPSSSSHTTSTEQQYPHASQYPPSTHVNMHASHANNGPLPPHMQQQRQYQHQHQHQQEQQYNRQQPSLGHDSPPSLPPVPTTPSANQYPGEAYAHSENSVYPTENSHYVSDGGVYRDGYSHQTQEAMSSPPIPLPPTPTHTTANTMDVTSGAGSGSGAAPSIPTLSLASAIALNARAMDEEEQPYMFSPRGGRPQPSFPLPPSPSSAQSSSIPPAPTSPPSPASSSPTPPHSARRSYSKRSYAQPTYALPPSPRTHTGSSSGNLSNPTGSSPAFSQMGARSSYDGNSSPTTTSINGMGLAATNGTNISSTASNRPLPSPRTYTSASGNITPRTYARVSALNSTHSTNLQAHAPNMNNSSMNVGSELPQRGFADSDDSDSGENASYRSKKNQVEERLQTNTTQMQHNAVMARVIMPVAPDLPPPPPPM